MEATVLIAKLLGPIFIVVGIGVLLNLKRYQNVLADFCDNTARLYLGGVMALAAGILIIIFHNDWRLKWGLIITVMGWLSFIKGITLIVFPDVIVKATKICRENSAMLAIHVVFALVLGAILTVMGYFA